MTDISIETAPAPVPAVRRIDPRGMWSEERIELLKRLWADGLSASQIAAELCHVTRNSVIGKIHRLGLSGRARQPRGSSEGRSRRPYKPRSYVSREAMRAERITHQEVATEEPEPVIIDEEIPAGQRTTIFDLNETTCRWPVGDPGSPDFFFCGGQTVTNSPYCGCHARTAHMPPKARRDQNKPAWRQAA